MNHYVLICVLAAMVGSAAAQGQLVFAEPVHDFGRVPAVRKVSHRFQAVNKGDAPVHISQVRPSCGCTSAVLGQTTVPPGGKVELEVTFDPGSFQGNVNKSVVVYSDDLRSPVQTVSFLAEVVRNITLSANAVTFDDLARDAGGRAQVRLVSRNGAPVQVRALDTGGLPWLEAATTQDGQDAVLDVTLYAGKLPRDRWRGADPIRVETTDPDVGTLTVTVYWTVEEGDPARPKGR